MEYVLIFKLTLHPLIEDLLLEHFFLLTNKTFYVSASLYLFAAVQ